MKRSILGAGVAVLMAGVCLGARAQEPQVFSDSIDVRVVNVETVVTDKDGNLARGLGAGDFRLLVDGREVPIEFFSEISEGASAKVAEGSAQPATPVAPGEVVGKSFLVFLDDSFSVANVRDEVLTRLEKDLALLGPKDEMAVVAFDGRKIDVLSPWTGDAAALAAVFQLARKRPALGARFLAQSRSLEGDYDLLYMAAESAEIDVAQDRSYMDQRISPELRTQLGRTATAAAGALRGFVPGSGRRVMLMLSGAFSLSAGAHLFGPMIDAANRIGYTIYPVDVAGSDIRALSALNVLAQKTGGRLAVSAKAEVFRQVAADTSSYYWLGFTPAWKADDRSHRVSVEVRKPGHQARARAGFSDLSKKTETAMRAESVLLFGGVEEERRLLVFLGKPKMRGRREMEVPVTLGVPVEALALSPKDKGYQAEAPLRVAAMDNEGGRSDLPGSQLRATFKEVPKAGTYARFQLSFKLRNADQRLVFTVHDAIQGLAIWGEANVQPKPVR